MNITTAELPEFQPVRKSGKRVPKPPNVEYDKDLPDYNYTFNPQ
ncbi:Transposase, Rhodopirellula-type [Rhodopirellula baltica SWK14]|uniref:Transposase, Rhodopirellula-type n=1 Tax=Rhodopirellula baltica SWK14 TaxID=993516 RepID=L7CCK2_RHOBT|nr:Transposase, Rhodopirellula-type [Rhodopirellula baltica SWK14]ELP34920.1 Transposase, Rhodopirellula-type [Rhodopirellula baltica SWK14]